jgi:hypothetical protein
VSPINSHKLAAMLAARLTSVVPSHLAVRTDGDSVDVFDGGENIGGSAASSIVEDNDARSLEEKIEVASWAVLSGVQDAIAEALRVQWPVLPKGGMALPGVRNEGGQVHLWFGEQVAPVILLPPIELSAFRESS